MTTASQAGSRRLPAPCVNRAFDPVRFERPDPPTRRAVAAEVSAHETSQATATARTLIVELETPDTSFCNGPIR